MEKQYFLLVLLIFNTSVYSQVNADFTVNNSSGCRPLSVNFTDQSTGNILSWHWNFGTGNTSNFPNPSEIYSAAGVYTVTLTVSDGTNIDVSTTTITVFGNPQAGFTSTVSNGCIPVVVPFSDNSIPGNGAINEWLWDFGDGSTDTVPNPVHIYSIPGVFDVSLSVTDVNGCGNTNFQSNYILVKEKPIAGFTVDTTVSDCYYNWQLFMFTDTSVSNDIVQWRWTFGDNGTATTQNSTHMYNMPGTYDVSLIVTSTNGCKDTIIKDNYITINGPMANFSYPDSVCRGVEIPFVITDAVNVVSYTWHFGDGSSVTGIADTTFHTYSADDFSLQGLRHPNLILHSEGCNVPMSGDIYILQFPELEITADTLTGNAPLNINFANLHDNGAYYYSWNFGDLGSGVSNYSSLPAPSHIYHNQGVYIANATITNQDGCSDSASVIVTVNTNHSDHNPMENVSNLNIFPNPFNDKTTVIFSNPRNEPYTMTLTDVTGKAVRTYKNITGCKAEVEKESLSEGFYFVELRGSRIYRGKLVVK